jgi:DNA-binding NarL/FixJ family response regulator
MIKILIVNDQALERFAIRHLLLKHTGLEIIAEVEHGSQALDLLNSATRPDIVIAKYYPELSCNEWLGAAAEIENSPRIIVLCDSDNPEIAAGAIRSGVSGFLLTHCRPEELPFAVGQVHEGRQYVSSEIAVHLLTTIPALNGESCDELLSRREKEILVMISEGLTNQQIANKLFTSKRTVEGHRLKLLQKTKSPNAAALIRFAVERRLIAN